MKRLFAFPASCLWSTTNALGRQLYRWGLSKSVRLDSRVVSVGNLQAGGGGKTPLVAVIANEAQERGLRVGILLRGYRSQWEKTGGLIFPGDSMPDPSQCGDEAALLHEICPKAYIGVGANRVTQYRKLTDVLQQRREQRLDWVILDDGFQNWSIQKDLEILALTAASPWKTFFRDWPAAARNADLVVWTKGERDKLVQTIAEQKIPQVRVRYEVAAALIEQPICLVTGIADGRSALEVVSAAGYRVAKHLSFPDHFRYDAGTVLEILKEASLNQLKVTLTGKDWVKWKNLGISQSEVLVLEPKLVFLDGRETWLQKLWGQSV